MGDLSNGFMEVLLSWLRACSPFAARSGSDRRKQGLAGLVRSSTVVFADWVGPEAGPGASEQRAPVDAGNPRGRGEGGRQYLPPVAGLQKRVA